MRIVLDTNNFVSALMVPSGPSGVLLAQWSEGAFVLVTSTFQLEELRRVFQYPRIAKRLDPRASAILLEMLYKQADVLTDLPTVSLSPDETENPILAAAIAGQADLIVSGDKQHVLSLQSVNEIPVVTALSAVGLLADSV